MIEIIHGNCVDVFKGVRGLASIVTDPPGGGHFMGLKFDHHKGGRDAWIREMTPAFRVAREATESGSWGLFWSFSRTAHWTACALDDAGWDVVGQVMHVFGQGWPKGQSQLKPAKEIWWLARWGGVTPLQIDRCRVRRSWAERSESWFRSGHSAKPDAAKIAAPPGNGIEINPGGSWPPDLCLSHCSACREVGARKVKANGDLPAGGKGARRATGDGRIFAPDARPKGEFVAFGNGDGTETVPAWECLAACSCGLALLSLAGGAPTRCSCGEERWWACPVAEMDGQSGVMRPGESPAHRSGAGYGSTSKGTSGERSVLDAGGGASRFFPTFHYDAKASRAERQAGCEGLLWVRDKAAPIGWRRITADEYTAAPEKERAEGNVHATIKPIGCGTEDGFMRWAVRLVTPIGGRTGDPFTGSGSTAVAAQIEGHGFVGSEIDPGSADIARARVAFWTPDRHRQVLRDAGALKAAETARAREKSPARTEDLGPLFAKYKGLV